MKRKVERPTFVVPEFPRADPDALAAFDPSTKECTMNCGPHAQDPRTTAEIKFLCGECRQRTPKKTTKTLTEEQLRTLLRDAWEDGRAERSAYDASLRDDKVEELVKKA